MKSKRLSKSFPSHFPKSKKEESEFGKGKKEILVCKNCNTVYFYKSWHHRLEDYPRLSEEKKIKFSLCPACQMMKDKKYEGEIILKNINKTLEKEMKNAVKNMGEEAFKKDCQDKIISVKKNSAGSGIRILTTENQLAVRIAKKLSRTFKGKMKIQFSKRESITRINILF